jgi:CheY-like chemotaxis protein
VLAPTIVETTPEPFVEATSAADEVGDDRDKIQTGDRVMLIVDNDEGFSRILLDLAREKGFKGLVTSSGAAAPALAREYKPDAITLDIRLPDISGYRVLDRMKNDPAMRHIPVYIISTDEEGASGLQMGAMGVLPKPIKTKEALDRAFDTIKAFVDHSTRKLLLVAPRAEERKTALELIGSYDTETTVAESADEALSLLHDRRFDCVVFEPAELDESAVKFIETASSLWEDASMPLIVYSRQELPAEVDAQLKRLMQRMAVKRVATPAELLDQTALYLHRPVAKMPELHRAMLDDLHPNSSVLAGKKVLIVDDDIRNIFAVTSVLERHQMVIAAAETGRTAIEILQNDPEIDIVLMDIMMPEMDGHDTMRAIRKLPQFKNLPIVAVTAKAMKGDREKCIESGAWDYLSKPIDSEQMLRVLRAWLWR